MALLELMIYRRVFSTDYLIVLATNLCRMLTMLAIETTMMLVNLATELEAKRILTKFDLNRSSSDECVSKYINEHIYV